MLRPGPKKSGIIEKKSNHVLMPRTSSTGKSLDVTTSERTQPSPAPAEHMHAARGGVFSSQFAGEKSARKRVHHVSVRPHRRRQSAPTSLTLCEQSCFSSSAAHATKCQLFTFPWGNPREAQIGPKPNPSQLGALARRERSYQHTSGLLEEVQFLGLFSLQAESRAPF